MSLLLTKGGAQYVCLSTLMLSVTFSISAAFSNTGSIRGFFRVSWEWGGRGREGEGEGWGEGSEEMNRK